MIQEAIKTEKDIKQFVLNEDQKIALIKGYSGTGKTFYLEKLKNDIDLTNTTGSIKNKIIMMNSWELKDKETFYKHFFAVLRRQDYDYSFIFLCLKLFCLFFMWPKKIRIFNCLNSLRNCWTEPKILSRFKTIGTRLYDDFWPIFLTIIGLLIAGLITVFVEAKKTDNGSYALDIKLVISLSIIIIIIIFLMAWGYYLNCHSNSIEILSVLKKRYLFMGKKIKYTFIFDDYDRVISTENYDFMYKEINCIRKFLDEKGYNFNIIIVAADDHPWLKDQEKPINKNDREFNMRKEIIKNDFSEYKFFSKIYSFNCDVASQKEKFSQILSNGKGKYDKFWDLVHQQKEFKNFFYQNRNLHNFVKIPEYLDIFAQDFERQMLKFFFGWYYFEEIILFIIERLYSEAFYKQLKGILSLDTIIIRKNDDEILFNLFFHKLDRQEDYKKIYADFCDIKHTKKNNIFDVFDKLKKFKEDNELLDNRGLEIIFGLLDSLEQDKDFFDYSKFTWNNLIRILDLSFDEIKEFDDFSELLLFYKFNILNKYKPYPDGRLKASHYFVIIEAIISNIKNDSSQIIKILGLKVFFKYADKTGSLITNILSKIDKSHFFYFLKDFFENISFTASTTYTSLLKKNSHKLNSIYNLITTNTEEWWILNKFLNISHLAAEADYWQTYDKKFKSFGMIFNFLNYYNLAQNQKLLYIPIKDIPPYKSNVINLDFIDHIDSKKISTIVTLENLKILPDADINDFFKSLKNSDNDNLKQIDVDLILAIKNKLIKKST